MGIRCKDAEIILSKNKQAYQTIIKKMKRDSHLYISTFNFNMPDEFDELLLKKIEYVNDLKVIFNVYHFDGNVDKKTNQLLTKSLKKNPFVQFFYDNSNHSKIVSNGKLMYIGSSNVTLNSKNNFEAGVIIDDIEAIKQVEYEVFDLAFLKCIPIFTEPVFPLTIPFLMISQECDKELNYMEYLIDCFTRASSISEEDLPREGYIISQYIEKYRLMLSDARDDLLKFADKKTNEIFIIEDLFREIMDSLKELSDNQLGSHFLSHFDFIEDYRNVNEEYKDLYWKLNTFSFDTVLLKERIYLSKVRSTLAKLYHLRIKWIELIGITKHAVFMNSSIPVTYWLEEPSMSKSYLKFFVS
jgi:hypothetical protein